MEEPGMIECLTYYVGDVLLGYTYGFILWGTITLLCWLIHWSMIKK